jgi:hypothetical protein
MAPASHSLTDCTPFRGSAGVGLVSGSGSSGYGANGHVRADGATDAAAAAPAYQLPLAALLACARAA